MPIRRGRFRGGIAAALLLLLPGIAATIHAARSQAVDTKKARADAVPQWDTYSDAWAATDALGRALPGHEEVGPPRKNRFVGLFYFLWLGAHVNGGPHDITQILRQDPDAMQKKDSPLWGPMGAMHHWGEPLFGYYVSDDAYVLRKHAQMLADAGVDAIIFDVTNQFTYKSAYMALLEAFAEVRAAGGKTPQIAFLCPFWTPEKVVKELYADLYAPGLYPDLWFRWKGKPLILADPSLLGGNGGSPKQDRPDALTAGRTLGQSFTAKTPFDSVGGRFPTWAERDSALTLALYRGGPQGKRLLRRRLEKVADNAWLFLAAGKPLPAGTYYLEASEPKGRIGWWSGGDDAFPDGQAFADRAPISGDRALQIVASGGRNAEIRRFFTFRKPQPDYFQGPTGADMWSWLEVSPQHVFRNAQGEKEQMSVGVAQNAVGDRLASLSEPGARGRTFHHGARDMRPDAARYGGNAAEQWERALKEDPEFLFVTGWNEWIASRFEEFLGVKAPVIFVDQFNQEFSRDIEPMRGGHGDDYYYQMVSYIRRYKGVRKPPAAGPPKAIRIEGDFRQWDSVRPEYRDDIGDAARRDHPGYNNVAHYVNKTGRNDFVALKVARDAQFLYFYARAKAPITPSTDPNWMLLFLSVGGDPQAGWEGYDFVVNRKVKDTATTSLEQSAGGWQWRHKADVRYRVEGSEMMLAIRRDDLGLTDAGKPLRFGFKWADNMQKEGDILEFTLNGDSAPNGRFQYRYREEAR